MKRRTLVLMATIAPALLAACLNSAPANAQTVADYEAALATVQPVGTAKQAGGDPCVSLINYTFVSISESERAAAFPLAGLLSFIGDNDETAADTARARCAAAMKQTVIKFDGGLGEDIVPQPDLEDVDAPFKVNGRDNAGDAYRPLSTRRSMNH